MSLTEREKKIALECLKESADHYDSVATVKAAEKALGVPDWLVVEEV